MPEEELSIVKVRFDELSGLMICIKGIHGNLYIQYNHVKDRFQFGLTRSCNYSIEDNKKYFYDLKRILTFIGLTCELPDVDSFEKDPANEKYLANYIPDPLMDKEQYYNFIALLRLKGLIKGE